MNSRCSYCTSTTWAVSLGGIELDFTSSIILVCILTMHTRMILVTNEYIAYVICEISMIRIIHDYLILAFAQTWQ